MQNAPISQRSLFSDSHTLSLFPSASVSLLVSLSLFISLVYRCTHTSTSGESKEDMKPGAVCVRERDLKVFVLLGVSESERERETPPLFAVLGVPWDPPVRAG